MNASLLHCTGASQVIRVCDAGSKARKIVIKTTSFDDTVVWNPWAEKAAALGDMADDEYKGMVCVEPANAACHLDGGAVIVPAGGNWEASQSIHLES